MLPGVKQKMKNSKGVWTCKSVCLGKLRKRGDKMYWRQLCWQQRNVRVWVSAPTDICRGEFKPISPADYVCLHKILKNIYILLKSMSALWGVNKISLFWGGILHLSCQSPQEPFGWQWWMCFHAAQCLRTAGKGKWVGVSESRNRRRRSFWCLLWF